MHLDALKPLLEKGNTVILKYSNDAYRVMMKNPAAAHDFECFDGDSLNAAATGMFQHVYNKDGTLKKDAPTKSMKSNRWPSLWMLDRFIRRK